MDRYLIWQRLLIGGVVLFVIFVFVAGYYSEVRIAANTKECEKGGGVMIRSRNYDNYCIARTAILPIPNKVDQKSK